MKKKKTQFEKFKQNFSLKNVSLKLKEKYCKLRKKHQRLTGDTTAFVSVENGGFVSRYFICDFCKKDIFLICPASIPKNTDHSHQQNYKKTPFQDSSFKEKTIDEVTKIALEMQKNSGQLLRFSENKKVERMLWKLAVQQNELSDSCLESLDWEPYYKLDKAIDALYDKINFKSLIPRIGHAHLDDNEKKEIVSNLIF